MTELLAANPKAKNRELTRRALEQLGSSPLSEGALRKKFGVLKNAGKLPPLETEDDIEERRIDAYFEAKDATLERNRIELALKVHEAFSQGIDVGALSLKEVEELAQSLYMQANDLEIALLSGVFLEAASTAAEAKAERRSLKRRLEAMKKNLNVVQAIVSIRRKLPAPK